MALSVTDEASGVGAAPATPESPATTPTDPATAKAAPNKVPVMRRARLVPALMPASFESAVDAPPEAHRCRVKPTLLAMELQHLDYTARLPGAPIPRGSNTRRGRALSAHRPPAWASAAYLGTGAACRRTLTARPQLGRGSRRGLREEPAVARHADESVALFEVSLGVGRAGGQDPRGLSAHAARVGDGPHPLRIGRVVEVPETPERLAQVGRADEEHVDAVHRPDRLRGLERFWALDLDHHQQKVCHVLHRSRSAAERRTAVHEGHAAGPGRWIARRGHRGARLFGRVDARHHDPGRA